MAGGGLPSVTTTSAQLGVTGTGGGQTTRPTLEQLAAGNRTIPPVFSLNFESLGRKKGEAPKRRGAPPPIVGIPSRSRPALRGAKGLPPAADGETRGPTYAWAPGVEGANGIRPFDPVRRAEVHRYDVPFASSEVLDARTTPRTANLLTRAGVLDLAATLQAPAPPPTGTARAGRPTQRGGRALTQPSLGIALAESATAGPATAVAGSAVATSQDLARAATHKHQLCATASFDEAERALANLKTGEDCIAFFARFGTDTPVKFVHLNRKETGDVYRPYDLEVVPGAQAQRHEHYCMSHAGVVCVRRGVPAEFIPLPDWMRDSTIFNVLSNIKTFKYFLVQKTFANWRKNVRHSMYCSQRKRLSEQLFLAKPSFCGPFLSAYGHVQDLQDAHLFDLKPGALTKTQTIDEFYERQVVQARTASKQFEAGVEKVVTTLEQVCAQVVDEARRCNKAVEDAHASRNRVNKKRSILAQKRDQKVRLAKARFASREAAMLGSFVRLLDYVVVEQLVRQAVDMFRDLPVFHSIYCFAAIAHFIVCRQPFLLRISPPFVALCLIF